MDEVAELWTALDDRVRCKANPITIAALRLIILTGQREREVTDAEWHEFDLDAGIWKIPACRTKARLTHVVHRASAAVKILEALNERKHGSSLHVFLSPLRDNQPIYGVAYGFPISLATSMMAQSAIRFYWSTLMSPSRRWTSLSGRKRVQTLSGVARPRRAAEPACPRLDCRRH